MCGGAYTGTTAQIKIQTILMSIRSYKIIFNNKKQTKSSVRDV